MDLLESEIMNPLISSHVLLIAAALTLVVLSGLADKVLSFVEDFGNRWQARSHAGRPTEIRYAAPMRSELENLR